MCSTWNLPLPHPDLAASSTHESESLLDFTPTSEVPDPEIIVPGSSSRRNNGQSLEQTEYFSLASNSSHTFSEPERDPEPEPEPERASTPILLPNVSHSHPHSISASSASSITGSMDHVHASDAEGSTSDDDGILSDFGDGIRTPASGWTDVGSVLSDDAGH